MTLLYAEKQEFAKNQVCYNLKAHSPLWDEHQPADQRGELVEDWLLSQNASILNDGTATCVNRGTGGLSTPDITAVSNA